MCLTQVAAQLVIHLGRYEPSSLWVDFHFLPALSRMRILFWAAPLPASAYSSLAACRGVLKKSDALEYHSDGYSIISVKLFALRKALHSYLFGHRGTLSLVLSKPFDGRRNGYNIDSRTWPTLSHIPTPVLLPPIDVLAVKA